MNLKFPLTPLLASALVLPTLGLGSLASANPPTILEYGVQIESDTFYDDLYHDTYVGPLSLQWSNAGGNQSVQAMVDLDLGVNKAFSRVASTDASNSAGYLSANAYGDWIDVVTISDPALNGTLGSFTVMLQLQGSTTLDISPSLLSSNMELYNNWASVVTVYNGFSVPQSGGFAGWWEWNNDFTAFEYQGDPLGPLLQDEITFEFVYGEPFDLSGFMETSIEYYNFDGVAGTIELEFDLGNSAYWGGITGIYDANGNLVTGATLTSASGVNWMNPVPEPSAAAVCLMSLSLALLRRGRRAVG